MKALRYVSAWALSMLVLLSFCGPAMAAFNGQIVGTVRDDTTKAPIANANVVATAASGTYRAVTDAKGSFVIVGVVPDTYTVNVTATGYLNFTYPGVTVLADSAQRVDLSLSKTPKTIAAVRARSTASSAFQPNQTEDSYTFNTSSMEQVQGRSYNQDESSLLKSVPSVTIDRTGTVQIRGGLYYQTAYQFEGIDYSEPNKNLQNSFSNVSNFNLLNGVGSIQLIPGGGDATHGDTGTGLVSIRAKRGTYPSFMNLETEVDGFPYYNQIVYEYGTASKNQRFSNFFGFTGIREDFQYGSRGMPGALIGIYPGNQEVGVFENAASQYSNDYIDNFFYKFGKSQNQQLQLFYQAQKVVQNLDYNGIGGLCYASCSGLFNPVLLPLPGSGTDYAPNLVPLFPGQTDPFGIVQAADTIVSPFQAFKVEYSTGFNPASTHPSFLTARVYRTINQQIESQPATGIYIPQSGGTRSGLSGEFTKDLNESNLIEIGGKYEFTHPYGRFEDFGSYTYALFGQAPSVISASQAGLNPNTIPGNAMVLDFIPSADCPTGYVVTPPQFLPAPSGGYGVVPCGYLEKYFPNGIPRLPPEVDVPVADQQVYGWFAQDTITRGHLKAQLGLRLDGYNFLFANDPTNPPTIAAVAHQRLFEPHIGITYRIGLHDFIRSTYGRTLSIPLPGLFGNSIDRGAYASFNAVPSWDNTTQAPARYCGLNQNQLCASYGDQIYWLYRDAKFGANQLASPLKGSTFTNYDLTYSHDFGRGTSISLTGFFRRGYDIVEKSTSIIGFSNQTGLPLLAPFLYTNLGIQKATGAELLVTRDLSRFWSGYLSATYVNQLGNDPPGLYLPSASLALGNLYRSDLFSPLQATLAVTYQKAPWRLNVVTSGNIGYPYGIGAFTQVFINGVPYNIPNTNLAQVTGVNAQLPVAYYVDPQNPGTRINPNIIASNGLTGTSSAGSLLSRANAQVNLTIEYNRPGSRATFGMAIYNLFNQLYGIPQSNPRYIDPVATGVYGPGTGVKPPNAPGQSPAIFDSSAFPTSPYLMFPNQQPFTIRFYSLVKL